MTAEDMGYVYFEGCYITKEQYDEWYEEHYGKEDLNYETYK